MKFIDRKEEFSRLKALEAGKAGGLVVLWGRRRVGKTRLLKEWCQKAKGIYFCADESAASIQRTALAVALEQILPGFAAVQYPSWHGLLARFSQDVKKTKWRGPLVIDEIPYLISVSPELPSVLQKWVDHEAKEAKLLLAFCGSSQRMMQGAILDASAPLYGRADELIKLSPISISYMKQALHLKTPRRVIESYAIWGGIPRYWELAEKTRGTLFHQIDRLILDPLGPLHEEPYRLLMEEIPTSLHLKPILDAIGLNAHRVSDIAARIGQPATSLARPIQKLIELDLIQREQPYGSKETNAKKTLYKIKDPFLRFWFKAVAPRRSLFSQVAPSVRQQWIGESLPGILSLAWEELCRLAVPRLFHDQGRFFEPAGRYWQGQDGEWDVLSQSVDQTHFLIGEAKWTEKTPTAAWVRRTFDELRSKGIPPVHRAARAAPFYVLFLPDKPKQLQLPKDAALITAKEIIEALY